MISCAVPFADARQRLMDLAVVTALAVLMIAPRTSGWIAAALAFVGLGLLARDRRLDSVDRQFALLTALLPLAYVVNMAVTGWDSGELERPSRLLLALLCYLALVRVGFSGRSLFWGCVACSLAAAAIAHHQIFEQGLIRAQGSWNSVPFGNFSLLTGLIALAGAVCRAQGRRGHRLVTGIGLVAAAAGLYASALSGTRGGWLALLVLVPFMLWLGGSALQRRTRLGLLVAMIAAVAVGFSTSSMMQQRVASAVEHAQAYLQGSEGARSTSTGIRLAMWEWGLERFAENPVFGIGVANYEKYRAAAVASGEMPPAFAGLANLHNELISSLAFGGIVGGVSLIMFWFIGWQFFHTRLRQADQPDRRFAPLAGLLVMVGTALFSMTEGLLGTSPGSTALALLLAITAAATKLSTDANAPTYA